MTLGGKKKTNIHLSDVNVLVVEARKDHRLDSLLELETSIAQLLLSMRRAEDQT